MCICYKIMLNASYLSCSLSILRVLTCEDKRYMPCRSSIVLVYILLERRLCLVIASLELCRYDKRDYGDWSHVSVTASCIIYSIFLQQWRLCYTHCINISVDIINNRSPFIATVCRITVWWYQHYPTSSSWQNLVHLMDGWMV